METLARDHKGTFHPYSKIRTTLQLSVYVYTYVYYFYLTMITTNIH